MTFQLVRIVNELTLEVIGDYNSEDQVTQAIKEKGLIESDNPKSFFIVKKGASDADNKDVWTYVSYAKGEKLNLKLQKTCIASWVLPVEPNSQNLESRLMYLTTVGSLAEIHIPADLPTVENTAIGEAIKRIGHEQSLVVIKNVGPKSETKNGITTTKSLSVESYVFYEGTEDPVKKSQESKPVLNLIDEPRVELVDNDNAPRQREFFYATVSFDQFDQIIQKGTSITLKQLKEDLKLERGQLVPLTHAEFDQAIEARIDKNFRGVVLQIATPEIDNNLTIKFAEKLEKNQPYLWHQFNDENIFLKQTSTDAFHYLGDSISEIDQTEILEKYIPARAKNFLTVNDKWEFIKLNAGLDPMENISGVVFNSHDNKAAVSEIEPIQHKAITAVIEDELKKFGELNDYRYLGLYTKTCEAVKEFEQRISKVKNINSSEYKRLEDSAETIQEAIQKTNACLVAQHKYDAAILTKTGDVTVLSNELTRARNDAVIAIKELDKPDRSVARTIGSVTGTIGTCLLGIIVTAALYGVIYATVGALLGAGWGAFPMIFAGMIHGTIASIVCGGGPQGAIAALINIPLFKGMVVGGGVAGAVSGGIGFFSSRDNLGDAREQIAEELWDVVDALPPVPTPVLGV